MFRRRLTEKTKRLELFANDGAGIDAYPCYVDDEIGYVVGVDTWATTTGGVEVNAVLSLSVEQAETLRGRLTEALVKVN